MKAKGYGEIVQDAMDAVESLEEPFRSIAFQEILRTLLREPAQDVEKIEEERKERLDVTKRRGGYLQSKGIQTLPQVVNLLQPDSHPLKARLIAYSIRELGGIVVFQTKDIKSGYKAALLKPSTNISHVIRMNKKEGFFMDAEDENGVQGYSITIEGIRDIEERIENALGSKE